MWNVKVCFVVLGLVLAAGCGTQQLRSREYSIGDAPNPAKPSVDAYVIGTGDALEIIVWKEPTLSGPVKVRPDGLITLPLINEVQAAGKTTGQLRQTLEDRYKKYVQAPNVTIRVTEITSSEVFLVGQVAKPGAYPSTGHDTVLQLITRAGGLTIFADRHNVKVVRRENSKVREYLVDYDAIIKGDLKQDIVLRAGDRVIVD
ncbi:MAG TPA: polysaccharide biosynthesis/export family protein [Candidatus Binatia bacterium]|jgi:polysaccharide export outer membrane protein